MCLLFTDPKRKGGLSQYSLKMKKKERQHLGATTEKKTKKSNQNSS
jgi:hypothetical protein